MYIHNISDQIDDFGHLGMVNPNIVSGADLDQRMYGFYGYVADEEIVAAEQAYQEAIQRYQEAQKAVQQAGFTYSRTLGILKQSKERLSLLKSIDSGTTSGTSYDGRNPDGIKAEIAYLEQYISSESDKLEVLKQSSMDASGNVKVAYQKMMDLKAEVENLTQRQADEGKPPLETKTTSGVDADGAGSGGTYQGGNYSSGGGSMSGSEEAPAAEVALMPVKKDLITKIGDIIGLSRQHTIFALGGAAVLGVVILTKK